MKRRDFVLKVAASASLVGATSKVLDLIGRPANAQISPLLLRSRISTFNLIEATIPEIQSALYSGLLTYEELVQLYLNRIATYDNIINAIRDLNSKSLQIAKRLDRQKYFRNRRGPLYGIPVLLKDNINTADEPTTAGSLALQGSIPPEDAFITKKLRQAGAIVLGKANLTEERELLDDRNACWV